jgi:DNA-binding Lrp family transcriptional regulator
MVEYDRYGDPVFDIYEEKVLEVLYDCPVTLSTKEVAEQAGISWETAKDRLEELFDKGYVESEDQGNSIQWWVVE